MSWHTTYNFIIIFQWPLSSVWTTARESNTDDEFWCMRPQIPLQAQALYSLTLLSICKSSTAGLSFPISQSKLYPSRGGFYVPLAQSSSHNQSWMALCKKVISFIAGHHQRKASAVWNLPIEFPPSWRGSWYSGVMIPNLVCTSSSLNYVP